MEYQESAHAGRRTLNDICRCKFFNTYIKAYFIFLFTSISYVQVMAQGSPDTSRLPKQITYLLPGGSVLPPGKFDSLEQAWGKGRIAFDHSREDDERGIVHLIRLTDEMIKRSEEKRELEKQALDALLNKPAPGFELTDLQGGRWSSKDLRGKIVVLNFWFTSCVPCIHEIPALNKLVKTYPSKEVIFLAITFNDADQVRAFQKKYTFDYTLVPGSKAVIEKYKVSSYPTSMVIDQKGNVKKIIHSNPKIGEELGVVIEALL